MAEFYRFPHGILTMLVMAVALCIVLQALNISYSIRRLRAGWARIAENGMECAVLAVLFLFAALLGQVQYGLYGNFMAANSYAFARQVVFLLAAVLGTSAAVGTELIWPFFAVGGAAVLLPITERIAGPAYPLFSWPVFCFSCSAAYISACCAGGSSIPKSPLSPSRKPLIPWIPDCCSFVRRGRSCCAIAGWRCLLKR